MGRNWRLFCRSLGNHPGIGIGLLWPVMVLMAVLMRSDADSIPVARLLQVVAAVGALPWIPILWTAWTSRKQGEKQ